MARNWKISISDISPQREQLQGWAEYRYLDVSPLGRVALGQEISVSDLSPLGTSYRAEYLRILIPPL